jgi:hypothetical protein
MDNNMSSERGVYRALLSKDIYTFNEEDDDDDYNEIINQPKCFAFKVEIKTFIKYMIKECPKIF